MANYVAPVLKTVLKTALPILSFVTISFAQAPQVPQVQHVLIVLEENTDYGDVCGPNNTSMPFLCGLKNQGSFSSNYYSPTHPSIGNYNDLGWGVVTTNDDACDPNTCGFPYTAGNIVRAVEVAGKTWKGYAENLPSTCYFGGDSGEYAVRHTPIPYVSDVQSNCLNRYVAFEDPNLGFAHDLAQNTLPNFAFITPNLCDDGHDCTLPGSSTPGVWLQNNVLQPLLSTGHLNPTTGDTVVIVTFDESNSDNTNGGGLVYWFMLGKGVKQNYQSTGPSASPGFYSHESTLRVMAEMLGASVVGLGGAASAPDMVEFFTTSPAPPVAVTISPALVTVPSGGTQQFAATVVNTTNQAVTWTATAGTISSGGLFTAPAVSTNTTVTVTATSVSAPSQSGSATVTVQATTPPPVSVAVSPASSTISSGGTQQFTAIAVNTTSQAVTWKTSAGTISATGLFTAPVVSTNTTVTVTATSVSAPSQSGSATVTVQTTPPPVSVTVAPASATVSSGGTQQFTATVTNATSRAVSWKATAGTISATGLFTAPMVSTNTTVIVTATSVVASTKSASATATVQATLPPPVSVAVAPASATVSSGSTQQFTATVANATSQAVSWKATAGTISATGLFTAPVVSTNATVTVTATSVTTSTESASVNVLVQSSALPPSSARVQDNSGFTGNANSVSVAFKSNVTTGDVLLVAQSTYDGEKLNAPADTQGNAFSLAVTGDNPGNAVAAIYIATAKSTAADTVTCSIGASASDNIHCHIYDLNGGTAAVDAVGSHLSRAKSLSVSTSKATANASDYVFAYFASDNSEPSYTLGQGFGDAEQTKSPSNDSGFSEDKSVMATGVQTATATPSVRDDFIGLIVALKSSQSVVNPPPTAPTCTLSVTPSSGPVPLQVTASAHCTDPQNRLVSTIITWGDGSSTNGSNGSHTYVTTNSFTVTVMASDSAMLSGSATQAVTATNPVMPPPVSVAVAPASATVSSGSTQQFTATVANTISQAVSWKATAGTISATGLFTAPLVSTNTTATVTATSVAVPSQSAGATVQIVASGQPSPLSPSGPISIHGQNGTVVENLHITNPNGDCVTIANSTNIIIRRSEIGPCGGNGVNVSGGDTVAIYDSYIHPEKPLSTACCDTHDGIFANGTSNLSIQGNVIAYGESNIEVNNAATVAVTGNFLLNPIDSDPSQPPEGQSRGQNFQAWSNSSNVTVQNNYALSSTATTYLFRENQEDSINFGVTNGVIANNNYITGGQSPSGCGLIADTGANSVQFLKNTLLNTGQCGIGIADGTNQLVDSNKVLNQNPVNGGGNTAIYVWKVTSSDPSCGPVTFSNNIAAEIRSDGTQSGFWNGGGCNPVTLTNNTFDAAAQVLLEPASQHMPPPQIPPGPKDCVASSPFTNDTSLPPCHAN